MAQNVAILTTKVYATHYMTRSLRPFTGLPTPALRAWGSRQEATCRPQGLYFSDCRQKDRSTTAATASQTTTCRIANTAIASAKHTFLLSPTTAAPW